MFKSITNLFKKAPEPVQELPDLLALQSQVQSLKLDLADKNKIIQGLNETVERARGQASAAGQEKSDAKLEALFTALSGPVSQFITQADLVEKQGKDIPTRDVLALGKKMVRSLQENGLTLTGEIEQAVVYNPDLHAPISSDRPISPGQAARIRFVGVYFKGKCLRKALVDPAPEG